MPSLICLVLSRRCSSTDVLLAKPVDLSFRRPTAVRHHATRGPQSRRVAMVEMDLNGPADPPVAVPLLWLANDQQLPRLEWRPEMAREVTRDPSWLPAFVKLAEAEPADIEEFARHRGVLGVNGHGGIGVRQHAPLLTPSDWHWVENNEQRVPPETVPISGSAIEHFWEPIDAWWFYARHFRAILRMAYALQDGRCPADTDVAEACLTLGSFSKGLGWLFYKGTPSEQRVAQVMASLREDNASSPVELARTVVEGILTDMLHDLNLSVGLDLSGTRPSRLDLRLSSPEEEAGRDEPSTPFLAPESGLYTTLVVQLVAAVTSPLGLVRCSWCDNPYARPPERVPRADRRRFCSDDCRVNAKKDADRAMSRRRYEQQKAGQGGTNSACE